MEVKRNGIQSQLEIYQKISNKISGYVFSNRIGQEV